MQLLLSSSTESQAEIVESPWHLLDAPIESGESSEDAVTEVPEDQAVAVNLAQYLSNPETWHARNEPWTVVVQPDDDLLDVPEELLSRSEILIAFPAFTDGRGYSHAATLKQHHGYSGRLIAVGDVRRDQLEFMRETGFTAFEITGNDSVEDMTASLSELTMPEHRLYSGAALDSPGERSQR